MHYPSSDQHSQRGRVALERRSLLNYSLRAYYSLPETGLPLAVSNAFTGHDIIDPNDGLGPEIYIYIYIYIS